MVSQSELIDPRQTNDTVMADYAAPPGRGKVEAMVGHDYHAASLAVCVGPFFRPIFLLGWTSQRPIGRCSVASVVLVDGLPGDKVARPEVKRQVHGGGDERRYGRIAWSSAQSRAGSGTSIG